MPTPIAECSIGAGAQYTVDQATQRGWSSFAIYPNGMLEGVNPDGRREFVPDYAQMAKDAALDLLKACEMFIEDFEQPLTSVGLRVRVDTVDAMRAAIAKATGEHVGHTDLW